MIIVDTSVWIDYFNGNATKESEYLDTILGIELVGMGDLILLELLQGVRSDKQSRQVRKYLGALPCFTLLGKDRAEQGAANHRRLRKKGISIRKTADVIIATFCIEQRHSLLFSDRDFVPFVKYLGLEAAT